jgi:hypothetical protein
MKIKAYVFPVLAILLFVSTGTEQSGLTEGCREGDLAPQIAPVENGRNVSFSGQSGRYTIVNFWAAYDAISRVRNVQLWNGIQELDSTGIRLYSISMDERFSVYEETLKTDGLESTNQYCDGLGTKSPLYKKYDLKKGFRNFLIDGRGVIVAVNVTLQQALKAAAEK